MTLNTIFGVVSYDDSFTNKAESSNGVLRVLNIVIPYMKIEVKMLRCWLWLQLLVWYICECIISTRECSFLKRGSVLKKHFERFE